MLSAMRKAQTDMREQKAENIKGEFTNYQLYSFRLRLTFKEKRWSCLHKKLKQMKCFVMLYNDSSFISLNSSLYMHQRQN